MTAGTFGTGNLTFCLSLEILRGGEVEKHQISFYSMLAVSVFLSDLLEYAPDDVTNHFSDS